MSAHRQDRRTSSVHVPCSSTHRLPSSSFLGLPYRILNINHSSSFLGLQDSKYMPQKELLRKPLGNAASHRELTCHSGHRKSEISFPNRGFSKARVLYGSPKRTNATRTQAPSLDISTTFGWILLTWLAESDCTLKLWKHGINSRCSHHGRRSTFQDSQDPWQKP